MVYFKRFVIIIMGVVSFTVSFVVSVWMHPRVYSEEASSFSRLRGGPAVGTAISFVTAFANLEALRMQAKKCLSTNEIILGLAMAFLSVGSGVLGADMWRSWKGRD